MPVLSPIQAWVIALTRHVSGNLSVVASSIIVYHVALRIVRRQGSPLHHRHDLVTTPYHRLMLGFSIADILYSFWVGLSTLVVPASSGVIYGFGTTATCSAQGFFLQFSVATHLYMAILSTYFLLKIRYNVSDDRLYRRYEIWFHIIPWLASIGTGTVGLSMQVYNPMPIPEIGCWLGPYPADCFSPGGPPCTRGSRLEAEASLYAFGMAYVWLFIAFFVVLWSNTMIYRAVRRQERRNEQYLAARLQNQWTLSVAAKAATAAGTELSTCPENRSSTMAGSSSAMVPNETIHKDNDSSDHVVMENKGPCDETDNPYSESPDNDDDGDEEDDDDVRSSSATNRSDGQSQSSRGRRNKGKASRAAFVQSILYVSSAGFTVVWIFVPFVTYKLDLSSDWRFAAALLFSAFAPLQGVFNLMIFVRVEYLRLRSDHTTWSRWQCAKQCLFSPDITDPGVFKSRRNVGSIIAHRREIAVEHTQS